MAREMFEMEPDKWQDDALEAFPKSPMLAMQACTGPGKTRVLAVIGWNFLLTRPHPMIGAASINSTNLKTGLWSELTRLYNKSKFLQQTFEVTDKAIYNREHPNTWKIEARTWAKSANEESMGAAMKGLHADYVMWLMDEVGAMPRGLLPTVEAIFSGSPREAHIAMAGNPITRQGLLFMACVTARRHCRVIEITADPDDAMRTPRVSVEHARRQIEMYGRDNSYVLVNIFGKFPSQDINTLIGEQEVLEAMERLYKAHEIGDAPLALGVDVAREGDDASVILPRRGLQAFSPKRYRNITSTEGAAQVNRMWGELGADGCFIDSTGGFGSGWLDQLITLGRSPIGVHFASRANNAQRYANKRIEMYFDTVEWIRRGGALPKVPEIAAALSQTTYTFQGDRLLLEPKEMVKKKLGYSPDDADALALTFAQPLVKASRVIRPQTSATQGYDPFRDVSLSNVVKESYNPFR